MMQLRPISDALRCVLLNTPGGPNLAVTRDALTSRRLPPSTALLKESLSHSKDRCTLVSWDGPRLRALASVRMRAGPRAWEIERLYLPTLSPAFNYSPESPLATGGLREVRREAGDEGHGEKELVDLLEGLARYAGTRGAERVFLRVPCDNPVARIAQRTGFFPYFEEILLQGNGGSVGQGRDDLSLRPRLPQAEYALFQLYSASTPSPVRSGLGMTFDQWKDSRDIRGSKAKEEVYEHDGRIGAWLVSGFSTRPAQMELVAHPNEGEALSGLLDHALARKGVQAWLVPEYQEALRELLIPRGFREVAHYSMLIKTLAARVKSPSLTPVEARVWQL